MSGDDSYTDLLTELIKKQIIMLGPSLVIAKARKIEQIKVSDDGTVTSISGDPQEALKKLTSSFMELSGPITQVALNNLMAKYPNLKIKD